MEEELKHKPLSQTISFWVALTMPILLGAVLGVVVGVNSSLGSVCVSSACINYFIEVYKVPITISSLSLPLVAMVAAIQRSKEAFVQIKYGHKQYAEAVKNNSIGNYLKHREGFYKLVENFCAAESINKSSCVISVDVGYLYMRLFPDNGFSSLELTPGSNRHWNALDVRFKRMEELIRDGMLFAGNFDLFEFLKEIQQVVNILLIRLNPSVVCIVERDGERSSSIIRGEIGDVNNVIHMATLALRLFIAVRIYAGIKSELKMHQVFYEDKVFEMLQTYKDAVTFGVAEQL